jgi:Fe-Mn family superoxide dismutase
MPTYTLPELPYAFGALEPHLSARIVELHHGKHHAAYVAGANTALEKLEEARTKGDFAAIAALERALAFNVSGHVLHSIFWTNLAPKAGGKPDGALAQAIDKDFGSFDAFKKQLTAAASTIMGSGWAALVWEPLAKKLLVTQIYDHQGNVANGSAPLLVLDAWEHAFYLQYENRKVDFFEAVCGSDEVAQSTEPRGAPAGATPRAQWQMAFWHW